MPITHCKMFTPVYVSHLYRSRRTGKVFMGRPSVAYYVKQVHIIEDRPQSSNQQRAKPIISGTTKHRGTHESHILHSRSADACQYRDNWTLRNSNDPKTQDPHKSHSQHSDKAKCLKRKYEHPETFQQSNNSEVLQVEKHGNHFQQHQSQSYLGQTINHTRSVSKVRQVASSEFYSAPKPLHRNGDHHVGHERSELTYDITDVNENDLAKKDYSSSSPVIKPKWILKSNGRSNPECRNEPKLIHSHRSKWVPLNEKDSASYDRSRPAPDAAKYLVDHSETHALSHPNVSNAIDFETTIRTRCNGMTTSTQQRQGSVQLDGITSKPVHSKVSRYYNEASTEFQNLHTSRDHNPTQHVDQDENTYVKTIADSPVAGSPAAPRDTHGTIDNRGFNSVENNRCNHDDSKQDSKHQDTTKKMSFGHETRHDATCHTETNVAFPVDPKAANNNKPRPDDSNRHGLDLVQDDGLQTQSNHITDNPSKVAYSSIRVQEDKKLMNKEDQTSSAPHKVPHISFPLSSKPTSSDNGKTHESKKTKCDTQLSENFNPTKTAICDRLQSGCLHNFQSDDSISSHGDHSNIIEKSFQGEESQGRDHNPPQHVDQDENTYVKTIAGSPVAGGPTAPSDTHGTIDNRGFNSVENNRCNHDDSKQDSKHQDTTKKMSFGHETRHDATCHTETNVAFPVEPKAANNNKPRPDDSNGHGFDLVQDDGHQTPGNHTTEYPSKVAYNSIRVQEDKRLMNKEDQMSSTPHKVPHISFPLSSKPTSSDNGKIHESKKTKCDTQLGENFNPTETAICDRLQSGCLHNFRPDDSISSHGDHSNIIEKSFQGEESKEWDHNPPQHVDQDENTYLKTIADSPVTGGPTAPNDTHGTIDNRGFNSVENNRCNHDDSKKDSKHQDTTKKMSFGHETRRDATCHKETNVAFPVEPKTANNNKPRPDDSNRHGLDLVQDDGLQTQSNHITDNPSKVAYSSIRVQEDKKLMNKEDQMSSTPHKVPHISFPLSSKPTSSDNGKIHESKKTKCDTQLGENSSPSEKARHDKQEPGSLHNFLSDDSDSSHSDHLIVKSFHGEETLFIPLSKIKEQLGLMPCSTSNERQDSISSRGTKAVDKEPLQNAKQILYNGTRPSKHVKDEDFPPPCTPSKPRTESTNIDNEYNKKPTLIRRSSRNASLSNLLAAASSSSDSLQRDSTTQTSLSKSRKSKTTKNAGHYDQEDHSKNFSQFVERVGRSTNIDSKTFIYSPKTYNNINKPRFAAVNSNVSVTQNPESSSSDTESQDSSNDDDIFDNDESSDKDKSEKGKN